MQRRIASIHEKDDTRLGSDFLILNIEIFSPKEMIRLMMGLKLRGQGYLGKPTTYLAKTFRETYPEKNPDYPTCVTLLESHQIQMGVKLFFGEWIGGHLLKEKFSHMGRQEVSLPKSIWIPNLRQAASPNTGPAPEPDRYSINKPDSAKGQGE